MGVTNTLILLLLLLLCMCVCCLCGFRAGLECYAALVWAVLGSTA